MNVEIRGIARASCCLLLLLAGGCASTSQRVALPTTQSVSPERARIVLKREPGFFGAPNGVKVFANHKEIGVLGPGGQLRWETEPGFYRIESRFKIGGLPGWTFFDYLLPDRTYTYTFSVWTHWRPQQPINTAMVAEVYQKTRRDLISGLRKGMTREEFVATGLMKGEDVPEWQRRVIMGAKGVEYDRLTENYNTIILGLVSLCFERKGDNAPFVLVDWVIPE